MRFIKHTCMATLLLAAMLLTACDSGEVPEQTTQPTQTTAAMHTVTFMAEGKTLSQQKVESGSMLTPEEPQVSGMKFYGWLDKNGQPAEPDGTAVYGDAVYYASLYPDLTAHEPYLFADANRFLRPDEPLTGEELAVAVNMLAAAGAESYLPVLPEGGEAVTAKQLKELLEKLFPERMAAETMTLITGDTVTRAEFAAAMNQLLDRTEPAAKLAENAMLPYDLEPGRADVAVLMEASLHHTHSEDGILWQEAAQSLKNPAGFLNLDGWLYCVGEDGALIRDAQVGVLTFGADGRYTCGDSELDIMVAQILDEIIQNNPDAERIDLLRRAFEYSRDSFSYLRRSAYYFGQTGWEIEDAKKMITTGRGNCYSYAAVFWALGRGLGYETIGISGTMTKTDQPHSWVEIFFDGVPYVFDPEMEMVYRFERDIFDKDMFMVDYEAGRYWNYKRP